MNVSHPTAPRQAPDGPLSDATFPRVERKRDVFSQECAELCAHAVSVSVCGVSCVMEMSIGSSTAVGEVCGTWHVTEPPPAPIVQLPTNPEAASTPASASVHPGSRVHADAESSLQGVAFPTHSTLDQEQPVAWQLDSPRALQRIGSIDVHSPPLPDETRVQPLPQWLESRDVHGVPRQAPHVHPGSAEQAAPLSRWQAFVGVPVQTGGGEAGGVVAPDAVGEAGLAVGAPLTVARETVFSPHAASETKGTSTTAARARKRSRIHGDLHDARTGARARGVTRSGDEGAAAAVTASGRT